MIDSDWCWWWHFSRDYWCADDFFHFSTFHSPTFSAFIFETFSMCWLRRCRCRRHVCEIFRLMLMCSWWMIFSMCRRLFHYRWLADYFIMPSFDDALRLTFSMLFRLMPQHFIFFSIISLHFFHAASFDAADKHWCSRAITPIISIISAADGRWAAVMPMM